MFSNFNFGRPTGDLYTSIPRSPQGFRGSKPLFPALFYREIRFFSSSDKALQVVQQALTVYFSGDTALELESLTTIRYTGKYKNRLVEATKSQREILAAFGIDLQTSL
ncbi:hypothetical protein SDC9_84903 [bioreactor metagenome]|uniref:Uncharacterized protein n=1 Tax=bioreactor metagenome TaxID=1076179 RepID=A0A644ZKI7_9ZZZZ